ncbi:MAG: hypothetical protein J5927_03805 [Oscillospiraceae bacterium]|nr:hypothetical protein [Oscillospiraceae bacterium]
MKTRSLLFLCLLLFCLLLSACTQATTDVPLPPSAAPAAPEEPPVSTPAPTPVSTPVPTVDLSRYPQAVQELLAAYRTLRDATSEDYEGGSLPEIPDSVRDLVLLDNRIFYGFYDFDGNGTDELVIVSATDDYAPRTMGFYVYDGEAMRYLCPEYPMADRGMVSYSGGAFAAYYGDAYSNYVIIYRLAEDGVHTVLLEQAECSYGDDGSFLYSPRIGNLTSDQIRAMNFRQGIQADINYTELD